MSVRPLESVPDTLPANFVRAPSSDTNNTAQVIGVVVAAALAIFLAFYLANPCCLDEAFIAIYENIIPILTTCAVVAIGFMMANRDSGGPSSITPKPPAISMPLPHSLPTRVPAPIVNDLEDPFAIQPNIDHTNVLANEEGSRPHDDDYALRMAVMDSLRDQQEEPAHLSTGQRPIREDKPFPPPLVLPEGPAATGPLTVVGSIPGVSAPCASESVAHLYAPRSLDLGNIPDSPTDPSLLGTEDEPGELCRSIQAIGLSPHEMAHLPLLLALIRRGDKYDGFSDNLAARQKEYATYCGQLQVVLAASEHDQKRRALTAFIGLYREGQAESIGQLACKNGWDITFSQDICPLVTHSNPTNDPQGFSIHASLLYRRKQVNVVLWDFFSTLLQIHAESDSAGEANESISSQTTQLARETHAIKDAMQRLNDEFSLHYADAELDGRETNLEAYLDQERGLDIWNQAVTNAKKQTQDPSQLKEALKEQFDSLPGDKQEELLLAMQALYLELLQTQNVPLHPDVAKIQGQCARLRDIAGQAPSTANWEQLAAIKAELDALGQTPAICLEEEVEGILRNKLATSARNYDARSFIGVRADALSTNAQEVLRVQTEEFGTLSDALDRFKTWQEANETQRVAHAQEWGLFFSDEELRAFVQTQRQKLQFSDEEHTTIQAIKHHCTRLEEALPGEKTFSTFDVIRDDFNAAGVADTPLKTQEQVEADLLSQLKEAAKNYGLELEEDDSVETIVAMVSRRVDARRALETSSDQYRRWLEATSSEARSGLAQEFGLYPSRERLETVALDYENPEALSADLFMQMLKHEGSLSEKALHFFLALSCDVVPNQEEDTFVARTMLAFAHHGQQTLSEVSTEEHPLAIRLRDSFTLSQYRVVDIVPLIERDPKVYAFIPEALQQNVQVAEAALRNSEDMSFVTEVIRRCPMALSTYERFQTDELLTLEALISDPDLVSGSRDIADPNILGPLVRERNDYLDQLRQCDSVEAIRNLFDIMHPAYRRDKEFILEAIRIAPACITIAHDSLKNNIVFMQGALGVSGECLQHIDEPMASHPALLEVVS